MPTYPELDDKLIDEIAQYVKDGATFGNAFLLCGIRERTGESWRALGLKTTIGIHARLVKAMNEAKAANLQRLVGFIEIAAPDDWKAGMELLKRRDRKNYSERHSYIKMPESFKKSTPTEALEIIKEMVAIGEISTDDAERVSNVIMKQIKAEMIPEMLARLELLEDKAQV